MVRKRNDGKKDCLFHIHQTYETNKKIIITIWPKTKQFSLPAPADIARRPLVRVRVCVLHNLFGER